MAKTQQQYYDEIYKKSEAAALEQKAAREAADAETLKQIHSAIDKSTDATVGTYQQNIDAAPQKFQAAYDANAVNEAFTRKRIQESMANMGLTDSGYNLTTQTALSLQRGNADAAVSAEQREYVRKLEEAIDTVRANAEQQKQEQTLSAEAERQKWWDDILANIRTSSNTAAADMYAADKEYEAKQKEYEAKQIEAASDYASELNKQRESYAKFLMEEKDYTEDQAWASSYALYPSGDAPATTAPVVDEKLSALSRAKSVIGDQNVLGGIQGGWDWWQTRFLRTDLGEVNQTVSEVTKQLEKLPAYSSATDKEKEYMVAYAVANSLKASRGTQKEKNILLPYLKKVLTAEQYVIVEDEYEVTA